MMETIMEKQRQFIERMTGNPQGKKLVNGISKLQWMETSYGLDGGTLSTEDVKMILTGKYVMTKTVQEHVMIRNYDEMLSYLYNCLAIKDKVDLTLLCKCNEILSRDELEAAPEESIRRGIPIVSELGMVPVHPQDIPRQLEKVLQRFYSARERLDPAMRACYIHNEILRIYPFEENNGATARAMLNFELLAANMPPVPFTMETPDYYRAVAKHIKEENPEPFYTMILKILDDRLTQLLDML